MNVGAFCKYTVPRKY